MRGSLMPTKLSYKLMISFCLMSLVPLLIGLYIASLFIRFPFNANSQNLLTVSFVMCFSGLLSFFGYMITKQLVDPITNAAATAMQIVNKMDGTTEVHKGGDELADLSRSLRTIQLNARELIDQVEKLSMKDRLTGLYNGTYIRERLDEEIQRAIHYQRPCAFAYFLLSDLEVYKMTYGVPATDLALKTIAEVFKKNLSEFDRAARIKDNEFAVIFPDRNKKKTIDAAQRIHQLISESLVSNGGKLCVSVGISENPIDGVSAQELFIKAYDRARVAAKKTENNIEAFI